MTATVDQQEIVRRVEGFFALGNQFDLRLANMLIPSSMRVEFFWLLCGTLFGLFLPLRVSAHGDLHERIVAVTQQIERETNNAQLFLQRGELHREHQDWKSAGDDYDCAANLDPQLAVVDFCRARLLTDKGDLAASRVKFDEYLARRPQDGRAFVERARLLVRMGERKLAVADYSRGIELLREPEPDFFLERAQLQVAEGQGSEALRGLDEGMRRLGPLVTLQTSALEIELGRTNYDGALGRVQTIIDAMPRKENWLARRGEIELQAGRTNAAQKSFEASLKAIDALPPRLSGSQAMVELRERVEAQFKKINAR